MIAEMGLAALWLAATLALLQAVAGFMSWRENGSALTVLIKPVAVAQGALCLISFAALLYLFYVTDLSVLLVASNSHVDKPMIFKIAGTWGNHEGSMLLWVTILSLPPSETITCRPRLGALMTSRPVPPTIVARLPAQPGLASTDGTKPTRLRTSEVPRLAAISIGFFG